MSEVGNRILLVTSIVAAVIYVPLLWWLL